MTEKGKIMPISNNKDIKPISLSNDQRKLIYEKVIGSICKIIIDNTQKGYGFFCRLPNRKITNSDSNLIYLLITTVSNLSLEFIKTKPYIEISLNEDKYNKIINFSDKRIYYTNEEINLTFIEINPELDDIDIKYFMDIDENIYENNLDDIYKNKNIYIIERPHFKTDFIYISVIDEINDKMLSFEAHTGFKCFCTPIFNLENNKIIGINFDDNNLFDHKENNSLCFKNIINEFNNRNEIIISLNLIYQSKKKKNDVYFLSEEFNKDNNNKINESNTEISINNEKIDFKKNFRPKEEGLYIIKIKFKDINLVNCYKMFYMCKYINKIDLSSFNSCNITNMSFMFSDCTNLTIINISHFNAEKVLDISNIFYNCSNLKYVNLSSFKTKMLTNMQNMFTLCINLSEIDFSNFNTQFVSNMSSLFKECHSLKTLNLTSFEFNKVISLNSIFESCFILSFIKLNTNLNTPNLVNMQKMFYDCQNLQNIDEIFKLFNTSKVINMSSIFYGCTKLKQLNFCFDKFDTSNVIDMSKMFFRCKNLYKIDLNKNFNTKNVKNMNQMFAYCGELVELDLNMFNFDNVENMAEMFSFCSNLSKIDSSNFHIKDVNNMNKMFFNCYSLQKLKFDFNKSIKIIDMNNIFTNCFSLHFINLYSLDSKRIKNLKNISLFKNCFNLIGIYLNKEAYLDLKPYLNGLAVRIINKNI